MSAKQEAIMIDKLNTFAALLEQDQLRGLIARKVDCEGNRLNVRTCVKIGRKYANVDIGGSGRYMVELDTGRIYGIKAYGVIHRGHAFGTLDTIHDYDWSDYRAVGKRAEHVS
jgi:hypothetical protein